MTKTPHPQNNPNPAAVALGRIGGLKKSEKKVKASKRNGRLGGRPRKNANI